MGGIKIYGERGTKDLREVALTPAEQATLQILKSSTWEPIETQDGPIRYKTDLMAMMRVTVPAEHTEAIYGLLTKLKTEGVLGTGVGDYAPPAPGSTTDYYELPLNDALAIQETTLEALQAQPQRQTSPNGLPRLKS